MVSVSQENAQLNASIAEFRGAKESRRAWAGTDVLEMPPVHGQPRAQGLETDAKAIGEQPQLSLASAISDATRLLEGAEPAPARKRKPEQFFADHVDCKSHADAPDIASAAVGPGPRKAPRLLGANSARASTSSLAQSLPIEAAKAPAARKAAIAPAAKPPLVLISANLPATAKELTAKPGKVGLDPSPLDTIPAGPPSNGNADVGDFDEQALAAAASIKKRVRFGAVQSKTMSPVEQRVKSKALAAVRPKQKTNPARSSWCRF